MSLTLKGLSLLHLFVDRMRRSLVLRIYNLNNIIFTESEQWRVKGVVMGGSTDSLPWHVILAEDFVFFRLVALKVVGFLIEP